MDEVGLLHNSRSQIDFACLLMLGINPRLCEWLTWTLALNSARSPMHYVASVTLAVVVGNTLLVIVSIELTTWF